MAPTNKFIEILFALTNMSAKSRRKRTSRKKLKHFFLTILRRRQLLSMMWFQIILLLTNNQNLCRPLRTCRRKHRIHGWWENIWSCSDDTRFKKNFRVTKATFAFILGEIKDGLEKETSAENPVSPAARLTVCLYRLARGDYLHTIAELTGLGTSTVCMIVKEVSCIIVERLWGNFVAKNFPHNIEELNKSMISFEEYWQYPCCIGAVDGCHLQMKCPEGGQESAKEYHNFQNFYSIVLMAIVNAIKQRFMWASSGFPGNSHDAIIFQSTKLYTEITEKHATSIQVVLSISTS